MAQAAPTPRQATAFPGERRSLGSLGSRVLTLTCRDAGTLKAAVDTFSRRFPKVWFNLAEGIAVLMAPSRAHERASWNASELVTALGLCLALPVVQLRSSTQTPEAERKSVDPDESFFIGDKATRFLQIAERKGEDAAIDATMAEPPNLVVEVEHSHRDEKKRHTYRSVGVAELWELSTGRSGREPAIHDLQAPVGPSAVAVSKVVPGVGADCIVTALEELRKIGGLAKFALKMGLGEPVGARLMKAAGILAALDPATPKPGGVPEEGIPRPELG